MRVLEARFHPLSRDCDEVIVIARILCDQDNATVVPAATLKRSATPATMLSKLHYLITISAPDPFRRLQALRSRFWSFVELPGTAPSGP